ncbi:MAG: hypothetical protein IJ228_00355 [Succinivibrio sp.]|nr:hypothetical protein [Succinivibrio sp.]
MYTLSGLPVTSGTGSARALVLSRAADFAALPESRIFDPDAEISLYERKSADFAQWLRQIVSPADDRLRDVLGQAAGFLSSKENREAIEGLISRGATASVAARQVLLQSLAAITDRSPQTTEAERGELRELYSLVHEFISSLLLRDAGQVEIPLLKESAVIIAADLTPAQFLSLQYDQVKAVILEGGRASGHIGTIMRELGIPAVFHVSGAKTIENGELVLVDANTGAVIVNPPQEIVEDLKARQELKGEYGDFDDTGPLTLACSVGALAVSAHQELLKEHGLGLLRSEFLFLSSKVEPSEDEMTARFKALFDLIPEHKPITARTFDFAGDKKPLFAIETDEQGPLSGYGAAVGSRLLRKELRAMLRAAPTRRVLVVFPLVTRVAESRALNSLIKECREELLKEHIPCADYEVALMIETPAAVLSAAAFAGSCSCFIIGTSSLAEYASAPRPADAAFTPALAKMIALAAQAAHEAGKPVGIAGRYAPRVELLPFFYRMGVTYITVDGYQLRRMRGQAARINLKHAVPCFDKEFCRRILEVSSGDELGVLIEKELT